MSRIRVYELAKEAGMSGKELADKLVELGFDIKGHSSSVDDETAANIRNALRRAVASEKLERRVPADTGSKESVVRRKTTVIRRRPAAATGEDLGAASSGEDLQASSSEPLAVEASTTSLPSEPLVSAEVTAVAEPVSDTTANEQLPPSIAEKDSHIQQSVAPTVEDHHELIEAVDSLPKRKEDADEAVVAEDGIASVTSHEPTIRESAGPQITSFARPEKKDKKLPLRKPWLG
jgi:translation initiation factor IF-2